jgi:hypothetical protein
MVASDLSAVDQLGVIQRLQREWSDNAVSVTIYYRLEELEGIKDWLSVNYINVKTVSFLLHNDHGFAQAPFEEIDEATYLDMKSKTTPIISIGQLNMEDIELADCDTGACPVR